MKQDKSNLYAQLDAATKDAAEVEKVAERQTKAVKAIRDECMADLSANLPALNDANDALQTITKMELVKLKAMSKPPALVKLVLEAVCVLMDVKPVRIMCPAGSGKKVDDYWEPAKRMMGDMRFMEHLKNYDKDNISPAAMRTIRAKYLENPHFCPEIVASVSTAALGLCKWVIGIERYDRLLKDIEPKKTALKAAEVKLAVSIEALWKTRASLRQAQCNLAKLEEDL